MTSISWSYLYRYDHEILVLLLIQKQLSEAYAATDGAAKATGIDSAEAKSNGKL